MNVKLKDIRKTVKVSLPSYPESEVELYEDLLFGQMMGISKIKGDDMDRGILVLQYLIKDWNFVDDEDKRMEINEKSLTSLPVKDLTLLMEKANSILESLSKKNEKSSKEQ